MSQRGLNFTHSYKGIILLSENAINFRYVYWALIRLRSNFNQYHLRILDNLFLLLEGGGGGLQSIISGVISQIRLVYVNITIQIQLRDVTVATFMFRQFLSSVRN